MKSSFIPGIYNYCDRWCERCTFTSRCRNYESTTELSSEQLDINNKAFWENISDNFKNAIQLIHKEAERLGINLNQPLSPDEEKAYDEKRSFIKTAAKESELSKLCRQYQKIVLPFVKNSEGFPDKVRELVSHGRLGIVTPEDIVNTSAGIGDCFEIIQWYVFFIDAKLQRALHGKFNGEEFAEEHGFPKDSDGSAKIAIIAIERSMQAWLKLYELMPSCEDTAVNVLALLSRLKQNALTAFPGAMNFKRPGFDE